MAGKPSNPAVFPGVTQYLGQILHPIDVLLAPGIYSTMVLRRSSITVEVAPLKTPRPAPLSPNKLQRVPPHCSRGCHRRRSFRQGRGCHRSRGSLHGRECHRSRGSQHSRGSVTYSLVFRERSVRPRPDLTTTLWFYRTDKLAPSRKYRPSDPA